MKRVRTSIQFILIISALVLVMGCKAKVYDIRGSWSFEIQMDDGNVFVDYYRFSGSVETGDVYYEGQILGSYTVFDRTVNITLTYYDEDDDYTVETFSGYFDDRNAMSGNYTLYIEGYGTFSGTWTAL